MESTWKVIPGTRGKYEASDSGQIRRAPSGRIVKPITTRENASPRVSLSYDHFSRAYNVYVLVGLAWLGRPATGHRFAYVDATNRADTSVKNIYIADEKTLARWGLRLPALKMPPAELPPRVGADPSVSDPRG